MAGCGDSAEASQPLFPVRATTAPDIAVANLSASIDALEGSLARQPAFDARRTELIGLLLTRSQFLGQFSDLGRAQSLAEGYLDPAAPSAIRSRASVLAAVHAFDDALGLLEAHGMGESVAADKLRVAQGRFEWPMLERARTSAAASPTFQQQLDLALFATAAGEYAEADFAYAAAASGYRDVSPFPLAFIAFQRGVLWAERANDTSLGRALYEVAVAYLPHYVAANVHLAEIEASLGLTDQALRRIEPLGEVTEDPEPLGLLAEILITSKGPEQRERARDFATAATLRYDGLLTRYPLAFLDHGAEFFSGPGADTERALRLAEKNFGVRKDDRAHLVLLEAALAAGATERACEIVAAAQDSANLNLQQLVTTVVMECE